MIWAILLRDLRHETSYKSAFLMQLAGSVYLFFLFLMLSRMFTGLPIQSLRSYGSDYFPYVLTGIAVQQYLYIAMNTFSGQLREAQLMGTFEAVMVTPVPLPVYLTGSLLFSFLINTFHIGVFLVLGVLAGAFSLPWVRIPSVLLVPPVPTMLRQKVFTRLSYGGHGRNGNVEGREFRKWRGLIAPAEAADFQHRVQAEVPGRG